MQGWEEIFANDVCDMGCVWEYIEDNYNLIKINWPI